MALAALPSFLGEMAGLPGPAGTALTHWLGEEYCATAVAEPVSESGPDLEEFPAKLLSLDRRRRNKQ